jgi:hypothetical protein
LSWRTYCHFKQLFFNLNVGQLLIATSITICQLGIHTNCHLSIEEPYNCSVFL